MLTKDKVEMSSKLKQDYLEMLCFHNSNDEELEEDFNEIKGAAGNVQRSKWASGMIFDKVFFK